MLYVNLPTREEIIELSEMRSDACISIYLKTSPLFQTIQASRIELDNLVKEAFGRLEADNFDKRRLRALQDELADVIEADDFWFFHANSIAILATPDCIRTYRLANDLHTQLEVSDRFFLKPLMRAITFPQTAYILALSENSARVIEFFTEGAPEEINVPNLPKDALSAIGKSSITASLNSGPLQSDSKGPKLRLAQYARKVDEALRPVLLHHDSPLILVAAAPLASIYRSVSSIKNLLDQTIFTSPDRISTHDLVAHARPVLDQFYADQLSETKKLFELRKGEERAATDIAAIAKAATYGMVSLLMIDFDNIVTGEIDDDGNLTFSEEAGAYGVIDEIAKRALACGAEILAVRKEDMIGETGVAAILRYSL